MNEFPVEVQDLLDEFVEIMVDGLPHTLPPIRSISHHIYFILGNFFPNKATYILTPQKNEEVKEQFQELLDKVLIKESLSLCALPSVLILKKGGVWKMCTNCKSINKTTIRYRFHLPRIDV
jgi:hypothetical protein